MPVLDNIKLIHIIIFATIVIAIILYHNSKPTQKYTTITQQPQQQSCNGEIILYYATWCGYSKQFLPIWKQFQDAMTSMPNIKVSSVLCEGGMESECKSKGVQGYPTVIFYNKNGNSTTFEGDRNVQELINFVKKCL